MTSKLIVPVAFPEGCNMTLSGLEIPPGLPFQQWEGIGALLRQARRRKEMELQSLLWAIGDWLVYGEAAYGEKYAQAVEEFGRRPQTLMNLNWVASKIEPDRRRVKELSHAHHSAVAALPPPQADALLDRAEEENASAMDTRKMVRNERDRDAGKVPEVETARRALGRAVLALTEVSRSKRAELVAVYLIKPLAQMYRSGIAQQNFVDKMFSLSEDAG